MAAKTNKRLYSYEYIKFGFTSIIECGVGKPQCIICSKILSKIPWSQVCWRGTWKGAIQIPDHKNKDTMFFRRMENGLKRQRLDASGVFRQHTTAAVKASYAIAYNIAKEASYHSRNDDSSLHCRNCSALCWERCMWKNLTPYLCLTIPYSVALLICHQWSQITGEIKAAPWGCFLFRWTSQQMSHRVHS